MESTETVHSTKALHHAVRVGSVTSVKLLLWTGSQINAVDDRERTALHVACENPEDWGVQRVIEELLALGAEVNVRNDRGRTPLHEACWNVSKRAVNTLMNSGAKIGLVDDEFQTPLHILADTGTISVVNVLLANTTREGSENMFSEHCPLLSKDEDIIQVVNIQDRNGDTALHLACGKNNKAVVCLLLGMGAKVGVRNRKGSTALHKAVIACAGDVADILLENGEDVNAKDFAGDTPLHLACSINCYNLPSTRRDQMIESFLNKGAKVFEKNLRLKTPYEELNANFCKLNSELDAYLLNLRKEEMKKMEETFIKHVVKVRVLNMEDDLDIISWKLGPDFYGKLSNQCYEELEDMKSTVIVKDVSVFKVLSHINPPFPLSNDLLLIDNYLCSPDLLSRFPLYGHTLRATFLRSKLLTGGSAAPAAEAANDEEPSVK